MILSGTTTITKITANTMQAWRQPSASISDWSHGRMTIAPTPTPENAIPMARPRRRTNQLGKNIEWT